MTGRSDYIALGSDVRAVTDRDAVYIFSRSGSFCLRGRGLHSLHQRLEPLLDGRFTYEQLLASAGSGARAVELYCDRLGQIGALSGSSSSQKMPAGFPRPNAELQVWQAADKRMAISLAGGGQRVAGAFNICVVTRAELERQLIGEAMHARTGGSLWIVCDRMVDHAELDRRATVVRYLLATMLYRSNLDHMFVFELSAERLSLRRVAEIDRDATSMPSLCVQLGLIRAADCPQLPLAVFVGELRGLDRRLIAYGIHGEQVQEALSFHLLGREVLALLAPLPCRVHALSACGERVSGQVPVGADCERLVFASSATAYVEALLSAWVLNCCKPDGQTVDLLAVPASSRRVAILQNALRLRRASLKAVVDDRYSPLLIIRAGGMVVARVGAEEAVCEALIRLTASHYDIDDGSSIACAPAERSSISVRRDLRCALARVPQGICAASGRIRWLGRTVLFGTLVESPDRVP
jgi:hypothetical protein